jgi:hypothetical protein
VSFPSTGPDHLAPVVASRPAALSGAARSASFADDIAIDFPAVHALLDRIRDWHLAGEDAPRIVRAAVSLSAREARDGAIVSLRASLPADCFACGGRGETWMERCEPCDGCGDAYVSREVWVRTPPDVCDGDRLRFTVTPPAAPTTTLEVTVAVRASGRRVPARDAKR